MVYYIIFYYGTDRKVEKPIYNHSGSNPSKDYGIGSHLNSNTEEQIMCWISILVNNKFSKVEIENNKELNDNVQYCTLSL